MAGYIGSKAVLLSTTAAVVTGDADIGGDLTVDTNTLFVDAANNRVGVGTNAPGSKLDVSSAVGTSPASFDAGEIFVVGNPSQAPADSREVSFGTAPGGGGYLRTIRDMSFVTVGDERMRITSNGSVGIGTSSPNKSGSNTALTINAASGQYPTIELSTGETGRWYINADATNVYDTAMNNTNRTFATGGSERMRIRNDGRVGVNHTTAGAQFAVKKNGSEGDWNNRSVLIEDTTAGASQPGIGFHAAGNSSAGILKFWGGSSTFEFRNSSDTGFVNANAATFINSSDYRLKEDITPLTNASEKVASLKPCAFKWIEDSKPALGFLAHEVQEVVPEAVFGEKDGMRADGSAEYQGINQSAIVAVLTAALQEALTKIDALEARIVTLEGGAA